MRKFTLIFFSATLLASCSNPAKPEPSEPSVNTTEDQIPKPEDLSKDLAVFGKYDCATCHKKEEKLQGPSYAEVAKKYSGQADAVQYLSNKIIEGGVGVWGNVPMNPHPNVTKEDAEAISKFILTLKK